MHENMFEEISKIKQIFTDSRETFTSLYTQLHVDFTERVVKLADKTTAIDEVRDLYERQIEIHREDMKRLDFKTERAIREVFQEKNWLRVFTEGFENKIEERFLAVEQSQLLVNDIWKETANDLRKIDIKIEKVLPLRTVQKVCEILTKTTFDRRLQARI